MIQVINQIRYYNILHAKVSFNVISNFVLKFSFLLADMADDLDKLKIDDDQGNVLHLAYSLLAFSYLVQHVADC